MGHRDSVRACTTNLRAGGDKWNCDTSRDRRESSSRNPAPRSGCRKILAGSKPSLCRKWSNRFSFAQRVRSFQTPVGQRVKPRLQPAQRPDNDMAPVNDHQRDRENFYEIRDHCIHSGLPRSIIRSIARLSIRRTFRFGSIHFWQTAHASCVDKFGNARSIGTGKAQLQYSLIRKNSHEAQLWIGLSPSAAEPQLNASVKSQRLDDVGSRISSSAIDRQLKFRRDRAGAVSDDRRTGVHPVDVARAAAVRNRHRPGFRFVRSVADRTESPPANFFRLWDEAGQESQPAEEREAEDRSSANSFRIGARSRDHARSTSRAPPDGQTFFATDDRPMCIFATSNEAMPQHLRPRSGGKILSGKPPSFSDNPNQRLDHIRGEHRPNLLADKRHAHSLPRAPRLTIG